MPVTSIGKGNLQDIAAGRPPRSAVTVTMVAAPVAVVAAPAALTSIPVVFTWTLGDPGVTDGTATIADGSSIGDDNDADNPISALEDQYNKAQADIAAQKVELDLLIVDVAAQKDELDLLIIDTAAIRTAIRENLGIIA